MPKITVLTGHDAAWKPVGDISVPNKQAYCDRHGYSFVYRQDSCSRQPHWLKIAWLMDELPRAEWIFWTDADSLVMNQARRLEEFLDVPPETQLVIRKEVCPGQTEESILTGEFFIRNTSWSMALLKQVWDSTGFDNHPFLEQEALSHIWRSSPEVQQKVKAMAGDWWNCWRPNYRPGYFIVHFPGDGSAWQRAQIMYDFLIRHAERPPHIPTLAMQNVISWTVKGAPGWLNLLDTLARVEHRFDPTTVRDLEDVLARLQTIVLKQRQLNALPPAPLPHYGKVNAMPAALIFRQNTWDESIWKSVAIDNEYGLFHRFASDDVVLDIGAHIGAFAFLCLDHGAGKVVCVEPERENFLILRHNMHMACEATDRAICISAAAWRSDVLTNAVAMNTVGKNTGGAMTVGDGGYPVAAVAFNQLVELSCSLSPVGRVRLCKLDCEGAEYPILGTSRLDKIDAVTGEWHAIADVSAFPSLCGMGLPAVLDENYLRTMFERSGFLFWSSDAGGLGLFRAWRDGDEIFKPA